MTFPHAGRGERVFAALVVPGNACSGCERVALPVVLSGDPPNALGMEPFVPDQASENLPHRPCLGPCFGDVRQVRGMTQSVEALHYFFPSAREKRLPLAVPGNRFRGRMEPDGREVVVGLGVGKMSYNLTDGAPARPWKEPLVS